MKVCIVLLLAAYGAYAQDVTMSHIRLRWKEPVAPFVKECMEESRVKPHTLDEFYQSQSANKVPDDVSFKCQAKCYAQKLKVFSATGEVDVQKWIDILEYVDLQVAQKCAELKESDLCEKAFLMIKCVDDELSKRYPP